MSTLSDATGRQFHLYGLRLTAVAEYRYVGITRQGAETRFASHLKAARAGKRKLPVYDWIRARGADLVSCDLLAEFESWDLLCLAEIDAIRQFRSEGHRLLNLTDGGEGPSGRPWTDAQRAAHSIRMRARPGPGPWAGITGDRSPMFGKHHSAETRARWSAIRQGSITGPLNPNFGKTGPANHMFGKPKSAETRAKLSAGRLGALNPNYGKSPSPEARRRQSEALAGKPMPSSVRSAHTRHHTNKNVFNSNCRHCIDDSNRIASTANHFQENTPS